MRNLLRKPRVRAYALDAALIVLLAIIAAEYALSYNIFLQAIPHDTTYHIYAAQQILEGHAIYRDVAIIKAPLADFFTAAALVVGRAVGISDIMSARLMSLLTALATVSVTYWAGRVLFRSRAVGFIAGLLMAGWDFYGLRAVTGPEPKAFLILFALPTFIFIAQKKWWLAGICAALTALSWQPGLMVSALALAAAFLAPYLEPQTQIPRWRIGLRQMLFVIGGWSIPFALVLVYLVSSDALVPAWNATIGANVTHFNTTQARTPLPQMLRDNFAEMIEDGGQYCFSPREDWLLLAGAFGFLGILVSDIARAARVKRVPLNLQRTPILLYTIGFIAFSFIDFDFCPDLFPLLPLWAIYAGWLVWTLARVSGTFLARHINRVNARVAQASLVVVAVLLILFVYLFDVRAYTVTGSNFQDQQYVVLMAQKYLGPGDTVLSFGSAIVPVELRLQNASKIVHLGSKSGLGVLAFEPGGLQGMVYDLNRRPPKLITLARENHLEWQAPFYAWLNEFYEPADVFPRANMRFFVRKP